MVKKQTAGRGRLEMRAPKFAELKKDMMNVAMENGFYRLSVK